jgi:hypothetical protein
MISNFLQETTSIYQKTSNFYVVKVNEVKELPYIDEEISTLIEQKKPLVGVNVAVGTRIDASSNTVFVYIPLGEKVEVGDYLLVENIEEGYASYIRKVYSPIIKTLIQ